ncbi:MAG TPA: ElyC/SanA/YdcF family protein [Chitinophagales bacterium]|nr:YdcF family protein [Bacteroidota bacterium]MCB9074713.1 YdcF family protein [Chitinophagales bacterium]MCB0513753.1 YdcF family protein [Bacteroidota bacterium]HMU98450.1 ElyC/SanA/YdcF family protein [Chitinophagales bacterium]HMV03438.1 ElyC/SanA/YdcF family protein [Chitinophagales bacterium]
MFSKLFSKKTIILLCTFVFLITISAIVFCNNKVEQFSNDKLYNDINKIPHNHVGLLLGTCKTLKDRITINPFWQHRLEATYLLWKHKKIDIILISGDGGWHGYNEPEDFRKAFLKLGVPDSVIVIDAAGFRTHDSVIRALKIFGLKKFTIISQLFHNKRALVIANKYNIDAIGFNANDIGRKHAWFNYFREKLARVKLFLDLYILNTQPHLLDDTRFIN